MPSKITMKAATLFWLLLLQATGVVPQTQCQNGGTFDLVYHACICTAYFYGVNCETAFSSSDPCVNPSIREIVDSSGSHGPGNTRDCAVTGGCIDFSALKEDWYRIRSPAGDSLSTSCLDSLNGCGSTKQYIITNIVSETNANIRLYSARLSRAGEFGAQCYNPTESPNLVRILSCGSFELYFLWPTMARDHHYCIGNKKRCAAGLNSLDGGGYEPCYNASLCIPTVKSGAVQVPVLQQIRNDLNSRYYESIFSCSIQDAFETNFTKGLRYRVMFRLTYHNSTRIIIPECTVNNLTLSAGGRATVSCHYQKILIPHSNIYGGTLDCVLQAKCNADTSDYVSQELTSLPHRFEFLYNFLDPTTQADTSVLIPSGPIKLCINITKVPIIGLVTLRITARREALVANDKLSLKIAPPLTNETAVDNDFCAIKFQGMNVHYGNVCSLITLINDDEEGLIVRGLDPSQMVPIVEVNLSYRSDDRSGVYTANEWVKTQSRQLTVDISSLYGTDRKDYFHVYSDPICKPALSDQMYVAIFFHEGCRVLSLMRHKVLPYEVQAKECNTPSVNFHSVITQVAISYEYHLIQIYSIDRKFHVIARQLERSALPYKAGYIPSGVTVEEASNGVRVKLDLYGTLIYIWGFITNTENKAHCIHNFIQSRKSMIENKCFFNFSVSMNGYDSLDVMIIPGLYDTRSRVDGLMYRFNFTDWKPEDTVTMDSSRDMFSYKFEPGRVTESVLKPTSTLNFCQCYDGEPPESLDTTKRCVIRRSEHSRTKRFAEESTLSRQVRSVASFSGLQNITADVAAQECDKYIQSQATSKARVVSVCSVATGIHGGLDFMTKFKTVCVQYATQLNSMNYTESIFNSIADQCITNLKFNVSYVRSSGSTLQQMDAEICPNSCSGKGACISGACWCYQYYSGSGCEVAPVLVVPGSTDSIYKRSGCDQLFLLICSILCALSLVFLTELTN